MQIACSSINFAYTGTYYVYVYAVIELVFLGGTGRSSVDGNTFKLVVDACSSCSVSTLVALGTSDTQPTSYTIGVENTPGFTLFSPFKNIAAIYCGISGQCGIPIYQVLCVSGCTTPPFSTSITVDSGGLMT